jgi:hypothetical protein
VSQIISELHQLQDEAKTLRLRPAARLNGSSDIAWETEHPEIFETFPAMSFFDYTKSRSRMERFLSQHRWPANYHLTFSAAPGNHATCRKFLEDGGTVAVVFRPECPPTFWDYPVVNGDQHDARFLDSSAVIVGLRSKSREADLDRTGFSVPTTSRRPR